VGAPDTGKKRGIRGRAHPMQEKRGGRRGARVSTCVGICCAQRGWTRQIHSEGLGGALEHRPQRACWERGAPSWREARGERRVTRVGRQDAMRLIRSPRSLPHPWGHARVADPSWLMLLEVGF
jgi:hypothetical protein